MRQTTRFNDQICAALAELGISHTVRDGSVLVDRTAMAQASPGLDEFAAYDCVIDLVGSLCPGAAWVGWDGRSDDYLSIAVYDGEASPAQQP